jgi:hypothetical protein
MKIKSMKHVPAKVWPRIFPYGKGTKKEPAAADSSENPETPDITSSL